MNVLGILAVRLFWFLIQDDDRDAEEWERYEALHEDVDKQVSRPVHGTGY